MISGRKETLENVVIKPNLEGRKTIGNLEIHKNGVSYVSAKGFRVDIPFSNMKHAFFQPCASDELIAIVHFTLKQPITMSNKKITDVQFFKESGIIADDIDMRGGRRMNDLDELELEERERQAKKKLTSKFHHFAELIQTQSDKTSSPIEFDVPYQKFYFMGCPLKSVVKIRPTKYCLIAISEFPFFVIDIKDIEAVHFERVTFGIKNFDMAIIYKDYHTFKRINSIPRESIEQIKSYLNEIGIVFSEGVVPINWNSVLQSIREDFQAFIDNGGWRFLQDDQDEGAEEGEDSAD
jgi:nucleosome binding factor SPN SPT16 subunit